MAILLSVVVVALVYLAFRLFQPFLLPILWAAVLAIVTHGAHDRLAARMGGRRTLAALLMTVALLVLIVGPCVMLTLVIVSEVSQWDLEAALREMAARPRVAEALEKVSLLAREKVTPERIAAFARENYLSVLLGVKNVTGAILGMVGAILMMLLALFFFYKDGPGIMTALRELMPMQDTERSEIFKDVDGAIQASVRGGLLVALVQAVLGFVILLSIGRPSPVLGAAFMGIASFIPLVGTAIVWAPLALYIGFIEGSPGKAVTLAACSMVFIGGADNIVRPIFLGRHMEAHPLMLLFGVLGGIALFGFAGIVLGPIVVAFLNVAARLLRRRFAAAPELA
jgi:predicted PurR-regulated permease PerM